MKLWETRLPEHNFTNMDDEFNDLDLALGDVNAQQE